MDAARAFNSGVPVQLVYDATRSITDVAVQLIGFGFTSFHAHMNLACLGFILTDTESEESYTTVWTAYRKSPDALLYKVKLCCIHGCQFCSEIESVLSHPPMASHKDSEDFKKHVVAVHASLGDQHGGGKNFSENTLHLRACVCRTHATVINKKKGTQCAHFKSKDNYEEWYDIVMAISSCPFENVGATLQSLEVEWLNEVAAAALFEQHWTGPHNGRWLMVHASYGNVTNKNCIESWWRWMKEFTCQKKRVAMCMFLANLFKHLRAESVEHKRSSNSPACMGSSNRTLI